MPRPRGSPKSPGSFSSFSVHQTVSSQPQTRARAIMPYLPLPVQAADTPLCSKSKKMGILPECWITAPAAAIIATRPCLISAARSLRKPSLSPTFEKPSGSKKPRGAVTPTCLAGSKGGGGGGATSSSPFTVREARMRMTRAPLEAACLEETRAMPTAAPMPASTAPLAEKKPSAALSWEEEVREETAPAALGAAVMPGASTKACDAKMKAAKIAVKACMQRRPAAMRAMGPRSARRDEN
mmetsp:Transcript_62677/g.164423  ORF Transcript_62677/g.164423 Transcript_62677/m.164423 type:complete len:240 (+) Transcript_62677:206-925(+)